MYVGVDGFKGGWVAITLNDEGFVGAGAFDSFAGLLQSHAEAPCVGVDMPFGLTAGEARVADREARAFLSGQSSSVFSSPPRPVLEAKSYEEACRIATRVSGKSMSKQAYFLLPKIRELDAFVGEVGVYEVHPEISFRLMNGEARLPSKKQWGGLQARLGLLRREGIVLPDDLGDVNRVGIDDVVDAAGAAWSARRIARGEARSFPAQPEQRDARGRLIAIWG